MNVASNDVGILVAITNVGHIFLKKIYKINIKELEPINKLKDLETLIERVLVAQSKYANFSEEKVDAILEIDFLASENSHFFTNVGYTNSDNFGILYP